jgi:hypothetical protein
MFNILLFYMGYSWEAGCGVQHKPGAMLSGLQLSPENRMRGLEAVNGWHGMIIYRRILWTS